MATSLRFFSLHVENAIPTLRYATTKETMAQNSRSQVFRTRFLPNYLVLMSK